MNAAFTESETELVVEFRRNHHHSENNQSRDHKVKSSFFFQNEEIFVQLHVDELEWDSFTASHKKHSSVMVRVADCEASDIGSILCKFYFVKFI